MMEMAPIHLSGRDDDMGVAGEGFFKIEESAVQDALEGAGIGIELGTTFEKTRRLAKINPSSLGDFVVDNAGGGRRRDQASRGASDCHREGLLAQACVAKQGAHLKGESCLCRTQHGFAQGD
jgi:hypothetical protein